MKIKFLMLAFLGVFLIACSTPISEIIEEEVEDVLIEEVDSVFVEDIETDSLSTEDITVE